MTDHSEILTSAQSGVGQVSGNPIGFGQDTANLRGWGYLLLTICFFMVSSRFMLFPTFLEKKIVGVGVKNKNKSHCIFSSRFIAISNITSLDFYVRYTVELPRFYVNQLQCPQLFFIGCSVK